MKTGTTLSKPGVKSAVEISRTLVLGDIHSNFEALKSVLEKCNYSPNDTLIVLGDLTDGYPYPVETIEYLLDLSISRDIIFIRGNHDKWLLEYLETGIANNDWLSQGGAITKKKIDDYLSNFSNPYARWSLLTEFLKKSHLYYIDTMNRIFVHGGFDPRLSLTDNKRFYGEQIFYWDRTLVAKAKLKHENPTNKVTFIPTQEMFSEIFVGHTSTSANYKETKPLNFCNVWLMDTGAGEPNGILSIMDVNTKEIWQA